MLEKKAMEYMSAVSQLLLSILGAGALGFFLEKWAQAKGIVLILCIIFGVILGFIALQKKISKIDKKN